LAGRSQVQANCVAAKVTLRIGGILVVTVHPAPAPCAAKAPDARPDSLGASFNSRITSRPPSEPGCVRGDPAAPGGRKPPDQPPQNPHPPGDP